MRYPRLPTLIPWPSILIIPPLEISYFSRNDFSRLVLRFGIERPRGRAAAR